MSLDIDGMLADLKAAPENATFVLHTVAHNPSGVDPTQEQWKLISEVVKSKNAIPVFDTAYQVGGQMVVLTESFHILMIIIWICGIRAMPQEIWTRTPGLSATSRTNLASS